MTNLDDAYARFLLVDFEYGAGFANHGPMAVEALESIGHPALIPAFVDSYAPRIHPARPGRPLQADELAMALGQPDRAADWAAHFDAALAVGDWRAVALPAVRSLLPGISAAAGHGLLRTMHALRALERDDNPIRRRELARGLAYWSATFRRLPGEPGRQAASGGSPGGGSSVDLATLLRDLPKLSGCGRSAETFVESMRRLDDRTDFRDAIERFPLPGGKPRSTPSSAPSVARRPGSTSPTPRPASPTSTRSRFRAPCVGSRPGSGRRRRGARRATRSRRWRRSMRCSAGRRCGRRWTRRSRGRPRAGTRSAIARPALSRSTRSSSPRPAGARIGSARIRCSASPRRMRRSGSRAIPTRHADGTRRRAPASPRRTARSRRRRGPRRVRRTLASGPRGTRPR
jgi:hypothetical protein